MFIVRYSQAGSKTAKSIIVSEIIDVIRQAGGNFCKNKRGAWFEVGDHHAREKVSTLLRDLLYTQYRSSAKAKVGRRWSTKQKQDQDHVQHSGQNMVDDTDDSDDCSKQNQDQDHVQQSGKNLVDNTDESDGFSTTSSCWGSTKESLGFEYWLEEPDDFFKMDVFSD
jgi:hypothetical protein